MGPDDFIKTGALGSQKPLVQIGLASAFDQSGKDFIDVQLTPAIEFAHK